MTTLTIEIPEKSEKTLADLVEQLGGKVLSSGADLSKERKLTKKEKAFLKGLDESIDFVNQHKKGKVKAKTIEELLNEL